MKVKEFFKSTAFKSLAVLLSIVIIAGALLAIFNDLLNVDEAEKRERAIKKIYGGAATVEETIPIITSGNNKNNEYSNGVIEEAHLMSDGNYLVKSTGNGAFSNGTVTVWVVVEMKNSALAGIGKVVFDSTSVSKYYETSGAFFKTFDTSDDRVAAGEYFGVTDGIANPSTGATASARAINNAVNTAIDFIKAVVLGQEVVVDYTYKYEKFIDMSKLKTTEDRTAKKVDYELVVKANGDAVEFEINVTVTENVITAYKVTKNGSTYGYEASMPADFTAEENNYFVGKKLADIETLLSKDGALTEAGSALHTGASFSTQSCIYAAAFATANFEDFLYPIVYGDYMKDVQYTVNGNEIAYTLTTVTNGDAVEFEISVTVTDKTITAYKVTKNGSTYGYEASMPANFTAEENNFFYGKKLADIEALLSKDGALTEAGGALHTGASFSTQSCIWAAAYALGNYDVLLVKPVNGGVEA